MIVVEDIPTSECVTQNLGDIISKMLILLDGLSGRQRLRVMKMTAAAYGHRIEPGNRSVPPVLKQAISRKGSPKMEPLPKPQKSAEELKIQSRIKEIRVLLQKGNSITSAQNIDAEALSKERNRLFRALKVSKGKSPSKQTKRTRTESEESKDP